MHVAGRGPVDALDRSLMNSRNTTTSKVLKKSELSVIDKPVSLSLLHNRRWDRLTKFQRYRDSLASSGFPVWKTLARLWNAIFPQSTSMGLTPVTVTAALKFE